MKGRFYCRPFYFEKDVFKIIKRTKSKYHVDISEDGKKKRTYKGTLYDSLTEMKFVIEYIEPRLQSGEIKSYERQVEYVLQEGFTYKGKRILPVKYRSDFNVVWSDGTLQVFDVKGTPDNMSLLKRKLMFAKYPEANLTFICRNLKYGGDDGWIEYDELKRLRREDKKKI